MESPPPSITRPPTLFEPEPPKIFTCPSPRIRNNVLSTVGKFVSGDIGAQGAGTSSTSSGPAFSAPAEAGPSLSTLTPQQRLEAANNK